jgi:hypothetical protein
VADSADQQADAQVEDEERAREAKKRAARAALSDWIPAFAGMTKRRPIPAQAACFSFAFAFVFSKLNTPPFTSTWIVSFGPNLPSRIAFDSGFSICCWIARFKGRAP